MPSTWPSWDAARGRPRISSISATVKTPSPTSLAHCPIHRRRNARCASGANVPGRDTYWAVMHPLPTARAASEQLPSARRAPPGPLGGTSSESGVLVSMATKSSCRSWARATSSVAMSVPPPQSQPAAPASDTARSRSRRSMTGCSPPGRSGAAAPAAGVPPRGVRPVPARGIGPPAGRELPRPGRAPRVSRAAAARDRPTAAPRNGTRAA